MNLSLHEQMKFKKCYFLRKTYTNKCTKKEHLKNTKVGKATITLENPQHIAIHLCQ